MSRRKRNTNPVALGDVSETKSTRRKQKMNSDRCFQTSVNVTHLEQPIIDLLKAWRAIPPSSEVDHLEFKDYWHQSQERSIPITVHFKEAGNRRLNAKGEHINGA
jgi:hypothetical protein